MQDINVNPEILTAAAGMLQAYFPGLDGKNLEAALQNWDESRKSENTKKEPDDFPGLITRKEVAKILGVHLNTVNNLMNAGMLQKIKIGRHLSRISAESLDLLIKSGRHSKTGGC